MTSQSLTKPATNPGLLTKSERPLTPLSLPEFQYEPARWSVTRTENVEQVAEAWQKSPNLVRIFQDPKFGSMQMALLRKDQLETLIKALRNWKHGQTAMQIDVETLVEAMGLVQTLVAEKKPEMPEEVVTPLTQAVNLMVKLWTKVSSTILVKAPSQVVEPSPLSPEELQQLEDYHSGQRDSRGRYVRGGGHP
ncbi:MAG: hypothetical protein FJ146_08675 [Deltaproteobacteria bacterium]|nr:hypothetical protein [Deltaproteobacteria bacterium]